MVINMHISFWGAVIFNQEIYRVLLEVQIIQMICKWCAAVIRKIFGLILL